MIFRHESFPNDNFVLNYIYERNEMLIMKRQRMPHLFFIDNSAIIIKFY